MRICPHPPLSIPALACAVLFGAPAESRAAPNLPEGALVGFGQFRYGSSVQSPVLSHDGKLLAALGERSVTVWDTATGEVRHRFFLDILLRRAHERGLAFSPDGRLLACGPAADLIVVWDLAGGKEAWRAAVEIDYYLSYLFRFSADGTALIAQLGEDLVWLSAATGARVRQLPGIRVRQISPDDKTFAAVEEEARRVKIGDARTGKILQTLPVAARDDRRQTVVFLPDGATLAALHRPDKSTNEVQFWDITTGKRCDMTWPLPADAHGLMLSADGELLHSWEERTLRRYSLTTRKELKPIPLEAGSALPHPDGKTLLSVGRDGIRIWDLAGKQLSRKEPPLDWRETVLAPDGRWVALRADQGPVELWDAESGRAQRVDYPRENSHGLAFAPDGKTLAVGRYSHVEFLRVPGLTEHEKFTPEKKDIREARLRYSPDGRYLTVLADTAGLRVFELGSGRVVWSSENIGEVHWAPDARKLLVVTRDIVKVTKGVPAKIDRVLRLHEIPTGKVLFEVKQPAERGFNRGHGPWVSALALSPEGRTVAVAMSGGHVCLLDATTGEEGSRFLPLETPKLIDFTFDATYLRVAALSFSPDGRWLAGGGTDGSLRIWEASTRNEIHRLHGHEEAAEALAFTADGRRLVSFGGGEGFVWSLRPRREDKKKTDSLRELHSEDGPTAYRAQWALIDDPEGPARLRAAMPPKRLDTRPERIAWLVADLDAKEFKVRDAATRALTELEVAARPALLTRLEQRPVLETEQRIRLLLSKLDGAPGAAELAVSRAVQLLDLQGDDAARGVLREWSEGTPGLRLTEEARAALARQKIAKR